MKQEAAGNREEVPPQSRHSREGIPAVHGGEHVKVWKGTGFSGTSKELTPGSEHGSLEPEPSSLKMTCDDGGKGDGNGDGGSSDGGGSGVGSLLQQLLNRLLGGH